jgi:ribosome-binding factor A
MARRKEKINELLRDVISEIVRREIKDPRIGFLSVTDVEVAPDLSSARVFVSVMGDDAQQKDSLAVLQRARGFLRTELARRVRTLRHIPELIFKLDTSLQTGARVFELLEQVKRNDAVSSVPDETEAMETSEAAASTGGAAD